MVYGNKKKLAMLMDEAYIQYMETAQATARKMDMAKDNGSMQDLEPQEGDVIRGSACDLPVVVVDGELFWNGQFISAFGGNNFTMVTRRNITLSGDDLLLRERARDAARASAALDRKYM
jgi:hypothetical protein